MTRPVCSPMTDTTTKGKLSLKNRLPKRTLGRSGERGSKYARKFVQVSLTSVQRPGQLLQGGDAELGSG
jgi:hypothetical protein